MKTPNYTKQQLPMLKRHIRAIETMLRAHFSGEIKLEKENIEQLHQQLSDLTDHEIALSVQN